MTQLFVYGTLMPRHAQGGLLASATSRIEATTRGTLYHLPAGYPALQLEGDGRVHGVLVELPSPQILRLLDRYEGVEEGLYTRVEIPVTAALRTTRAWAWVMDDPTLHGGRVLPSGRWTTGRRR